MWRGKRLSQGFVIASSDCAAVCLGMVKKRGLCVVLIFSVLSDKRRRVAAPKQAKKLFQDPSKARTTSKSKAQNLVRTEKYFRKKVSS